MQRAKHGMIGKILFSSSFRDRIVDARVTGVTSESEFCGEGRIHLTMSRSRDDRTGEESLVPSPHEGQICLILWPRT